MNSILNKLLKNSLRFGNYLELHKGWMSVPKKIKIGLIEIEKGIIDYPEIRERKEILLSEEDEICLERILKEIEEICRNESSPEVINDKRCKKCAYYEYCYI